MVSHDINVTYVDQPNIQAANENEEIMLHSNSINDENPFLSNKNDSNPSQPPR